MSKSKSNREFQIQVAIPAPIRKVFDYVYPKAIKPGTRVLVPFGRRMLVGLSLGDELPSERIKLKSITQILDTEPTVNTKLLALLQWAADYYHHPIGEVVRAALPGMLRNATQQIDPTVETIFYRNPGLESETLDLALKRAPRQRQLFTLIPTDGAPVDQIKAMAANFDGSSVTRLLNALTDKNLVASTTRTIALPKQAARGFDGTLTDEQKIALNSVNSSITQFNVFVLHGITGSGKTEVYLHAAERYIKLGLQVIVLVPEISLTPQLFERFRSRLGNGVYMIHSNMPISQRYSSWWQARQGNASVILGTRSAVFTALKNPGLIIVDEEHDLSYKQSEGFRYHGRDLAIKRASLEQIPIILGSATPSLETMKNAECGKYQLLSLSQRIGIAKLPSIELVDIKRHPHQEGISPQLISAIAETLKDGKQAILYINRRGFAPLALCRACDWQAKCDRCDAFLTYHQNSATMRCHHCGKIAPSQSTCPDCSSSLLFIGLGTQRVENRLKARFPDARITRFDRDQITNQTSLESTLSDIHEGKIDIIIGTQLISKGHDFPGVTLVGVLAPDQGLYSFDFRAPEHLYQQLVQVSGRAGRSDSPGRVIIQTAHPNNPYLQLIQHHDFDRFHQYCIRERQLGKLPPYGYIALWRAESTALSAGLNFLKFARKIGLTLISTSNIQSVMIMDPISSPMEKMAGRYRAQLLVKAANRKSLHQLISIWLEKIDASSQSRKVRWSIDIDPMEMF